MGNQFRKRFFMRVRDPFAIAIINKDKMQFVVFFLYGEREHSLVVDIFKAVFNSIFYKRLNEHRRNQVGFGIQIGFHVKSKTILISHLLKFYINFNSFYFLL